MADIVYTVNQDSPESITGVEQISQPDSQLINQFEINTLFDRNKNFVELHIFDLADNLLESDYNYTNYKELGNAQSAGKEGASILTVDPIEDIKKYRYDNGDVKLLYHFLNDLFTPDKNKATFFIQDISTDRTELKLQTFDVSNEEINTYVSKIKSNLTTQSYFSEFRLNFQNNDLFIGVNIDILIENGSNIVTVKLYEPLPTTYNIKSTLSIVEIIADSTAFEVDSNIETLPEEVPYLRPANFNLETSDNEIIPTQYLNYQELFSYPVNNTNSQVYSLFSEKGAELSIDHTDYKNFIHFSSAYERLANFKYKLQLLENYSSSISEVGNATSQSIGITGSISYYNNLTEGILNNFDHYERFLYYESSSYAWPKSNTSKPYINIPTGNPSATTWYVSQLALANKYDLSNLNAVINTIPSFLREDINNENYLTFIHMIGQHFDNLWIYTKGVSDKYNADNRLDFGISKDLIGEVLKNFGVKLYTSNKSTEDLFSSFIGQAYQSGSEVINYYITGSVTGSNTPIEPSSIDSYQKEIYKRLYHNLPLLLKSKGTERGLRALINCFGIPSNILDIKYYGGRNVDERPFYGDYKYYTSSLDKIRLDNTGSLITGSTLSAYTSMYKRDLKYTDDLHAIEVGFSPTDSVDNHIVSYSLATGSLSNFNIDNYIGDPRSLTSNTYGLLNSTGSIIHTLSQLTNEIMSSSDAYDVFDYVRLIKFFDNTVFKMVRDFIPARVTADTGIIIKPHLLQRNKAKSVILSGSRTELSGSIDTAFIEGSHGSIFDSGSGEWSTRYRDVIQTPNGLVTTEFLHYQDQAKYNGEFSGSGIVITNGNLNSNNPYLTPSDASYDFGTVRYVSSSTEICVLDTLNQIQYITSSTQTFLPNQFFNIGTVASGLYEYSASDDITTPVYSPVTPPFTFGTYPQYTDFYLVAQNLATTVPCSRSTTLRFGTCSLNLTSNVQPFVRQYNESVDPIQYSISTWFTNHPNQTGLQYTASWSDGTTNYSESISNPTQYRFTQDNNTAVTITIKDPNLGEICKTSYTTVVGSLGIGTSTPPPNGFEFVYSRFTRGVELPNVGDENICLTQDGEVDMERCPDRQYRFLGRPPVTTTSSPRTYGIPGYFTDINTSDFPQDNPPGGQSIKYRVFEVIGSPHTSTIGPQYRVFPREDFSPYAIQTLPQDWIRFRSDNSMISYATQQQITPQYSNIPGTVTEVEDALQFLQRNPGQIPFPDQPLYFTVLNLISGVWPVTIYTAFMNIQGSAFNDTPEIPADELVRAYIIQAYNPTIDNNPQYNGIMEQVVVYGEKFELRQVEGVGNIPNFVDEYLLVGHRYSDGLPLGQTSITLPPSNISSGQTWVKFPKRSFT